MKTANRLKSWCTNRKARKEDVEAALCLHVDIDDPMAIERIMAFRPQPAVVVFSGGGYKAFWCLDEESEALTRVERINKGIAESLGGDNCHNIDRIMRLPGTINVPNKKKRDAGRVPTRAYVVNEATDWSRRYDLDDFAELEGSARLTETALGPKDVLPVSLEALPDAVSEETRALIFHGDDLARPIGSYDAHFRSRSEVVFRVACDLARAGCDIRVITGVLINPVFGVSSSVFEKSRPGEYALRQADRAMAIIGQGWPDVYKNGSPRPTFRNSMLALLRLGLEFSADQFRYRKFVEGMPMQEFVGELSDDLCFALRKFVIDKFSFDTGKENIRDAAHTLCLENPYHPIRQYLDQLVWDGAPRIAKWLTTYLGAEATPLNEAIGMLVLIAAVRRVRKAVLDGLPKAFGPGSLYPVLADLPVNRLFEELRALVDPDRDGSVLEIKHKAGEILQVKTRGQFATVARGDGAPIMARAGHRLPAEMGLDGKRVKLAPAVEVAAFAEMHRLRQHGQKIKDSRLIGLREQWMDGGDLISIEREIAINLEFDFKRAPVDPVNCDGLIQFRTRPWRDRDEFVAERRLFDRWRAATKSCLRTLDDWLLYQEWRQEPGARKAAPAERTPYQQAILVAGAKGMLPGVEMAGPGRSGGMALARWAELLTAAGVPGATRSACLHARQREPIPTPGSIDLWTDRDAETAQKLASEIPLEAIAWPVSEEAKAGPKWNVILQFVFRMTHRNGLTDNILKTNETEVMKKSDPARKLNDPNGQGGIRDLGHLKIAPEAAPEMPAPPPAMDLSDLRHRAAIRRRLHADFGVGRLHLDRAEKKAPVDLPGGVKAREIWIMAAALAARTGETLAGAFETIGRLAGETEGEA